MFDNHPSKLNGEKSNNITENSHVSEHQEEVIFSGYSQIGAKTQS